MKLASSATVKSLLAEHSIKPSRGLGQNFLVDPYAIKKLVAAASLEPKDTVIEIGPGIGVLTQALTEHVAHVIAIEKDASMIAILTKVLGELPNLQIIQGDALKTELPEIDTYKVIANLPYYITAPTIRKFLESSPQPESITLIIQKEVAQRICAKPPHMNILATSVQFYATPKVISSVKKSAFWPQPRVNSAIIHIVPNKKAAPIDPKKFFQIVKAGFSHPRKQLLNNLSGGLHKERNEIIPILEENNITPTQRAETLTIQNWIQLAKSF